MPTKAVLQAKLNALQYGKRKATPKPRKNDETKRPVALQKKQRKAATVRWSHQNQHYLSDELLTAIEGSALYRQSFGFNKGVLGSVPTGGKKPSDLHTELSEALFITPEDSDYTKEDLEVLTGVVGNRIGSMKKGYRDQRAKLGATGQGLVDEDREAEIESGSNIENIWDHIQEKFPWYKRMHALVGSSPVIDRSALSNSQTPVDLGILDGKSGRKRKGRARSTIDDDNDDDVALSGWEKTDDEDGAISISSSPSRPPHPHTPKTPAARVKAEPAQMSAARGTKHKSAHDQVQELASQDRVQRLKIAEVREREKTVRSKGKYEAKAELELAKLRHMQQEAERQRQHDFAMMDRQIQLERARQQPGPSMHGPPGGPAYGAPPPQSAFDPALFR